MRFHKHLSCARRSIDVSSDGIGYSLVEMIIPLTQAQLYLPQGECSVYVQCTVLETFCMW